MFNAHICICIYIHMSVIISKASELFAQKRIQANIKEYTNVFHYWPFVLGSRR